MVEYSRLKLKDTLFPRIMQSSSFAFQVFQVVRYGALIAGAMALAWFGARDSDIDNFETMWLVGGTCTFFWVGGLLDGTLLLYKKVDPMKAQSVLAGTKRLSFILSLLSAIVMGFAAHLLYPAIHTEFIVLFTIFFFSETATQLFPYALVALEDRKTLFYYSAIYGISYMVCIALPLAAGWDFVVVLRLLAMFGMARFIWQGLILGLLTRSAKVDTGNFKPLLYLSTPLILATLLSQSAVYIDSYLVQAFFKDQFVDFRYGAKEFPLVLLLANSMSIVRAGEIAASKKTGKQEDALKDLRSSTDRLVWSLFPLSILLLVVSGPLFALVFKDRFPAAVPVFDMFLLLAIPRLMFPQSIVRGWHKTFAMSISAGVELVLNVGLSLLLMQWYGILGIAAGTVIAFMAEKLILLGYTHYKLGVAWNRYATVPLWLGWSLALMGAWVIKYVLWGD
jgi:O-antigen/teichoic acid export membrane protein